MTAGPDLDVWLIDRRDADFLALADSELPDATDRARAEALTNPEAGRVLLARRAAVKVVVARTLSLAPDAVRVVTAPGGKPVVVTAAGKSPALSIAHSGDLVGIAVGPVRSIGLDVERLREVTKARQIASKWFGPTEAARLDRVPEADLVEEFMRLWTAKEALAKRHGAGLRLMRGRPGELDVDTAIGGGRLRYLDVRSGYMAALASSEPLREIRVVHPDRASWTI